MMKNWQFDEPVNKNMQEEAQKILLFLRNMTRLFRLRGLEKRKEGNLAVRRFAPYASRQP